MGDGSETLMSNAESERRVLSGKELARELRRAAYRKEKERRKNDPRLLALREAKKMERRAAYAKAKERHKAQVLARKREAKAERERELAARRGKATRALLRVVGNGARKPLSGLEHVGEALSGATRPENGNASDEQD